jgi:hypothetical protein
LRATASGRRRDSELLAGEKKAEAAASLRL